MDRCNPAPTEAPVKTHMIFDSNKPGLLLFIGRAVI
jgi:hypothetical protein